MQGESQSYSRSQVQAVRPSLLFMVAVIITMAWAYFPTIRFMVEKWLDDPQYSHGFLVPLFSGYLIWRSIQSGDFCMGRSRPMLAALTLTVIVAARYMAGGLMFFQLDCVAFLLTIAALILAYGGWPMLRSCLSAGIFLLFMIPLPYEIEQNVGGPLKKIATLSSTFLLQTLGMPAIAEGHVILIDEVRLGVVDACSGLKMLMTFSAFAVGAVIMLDRSRFEKLMILLGIVPIAVITNVLRITATGIAYTQTTDKDVLHFIHDLHGWLMMPGGLALLGLQLWYLQKLVVKPVNDFGPGFAQLLPAYT